MPFLFATLKKPRFNFLDSILYQDDDYFLINKPPGISTLEDRNDDANILRLVKAHEPSAQVGHRLDKDTSGVLAIARNAEAYRHIAMQLEARQVTKVYHAIVEGAHDFADVLVDAAILKQNDGRVKLTREGKSAQTHFTTIRHLGKYTLLDCRPLTGRMHQIRVHIAKLGAPIAGDEVYGGHPVFLSTIKRNYRLAKGEEESPLMDRMALHAFSLEFSGRSGGKVKAEAPYPKDFRVLLKQLADHNP